MLHVEQYTRTTTEHCFEVKAEGGYGIIDAIEDARMLARQKYVEVYGHEPRFDDWAYWRIVDEETLVIYIKDVDQKHAA